MQPRPPTRRLVTSLMQRVSGATETTALATGCTMVRTIFIMSCRIWPPAPNQKRGFGIIMNIIQKGSMPRWKSFPVLWSHAIDDHPHMGSRPMWCNSPLTDGTPLRSTRCSIAVSGVVGHHPPNGVRLVFAL